MSGGAGRQLVFGYGSLVASAAALPARLHGHRRTWGVAMDNRVDIAGYKSYRLPDGSRPPVFVAFLDIEADPGAATDGALLAVDEAGLQALDERERNYERIDVTEAIEDATGRVWAYRGSAAGRARLRRGLRDACAVVDRAYLETVRAGLEAIGAERDADPAGLPVVELERVELPRARRR